jgi:hypothetical protein
MGLRMDLDLMAATPCSEAAQFRARAETYRQMAATARMVGTDGALLRLAARFDALAARQEQVPPENAALQGAATD